MMEVGQNHMKVDPGGGLQGAAIGASSTIWMGDLQSYMDEAFVAQAFVNSSEQVLNVRIIRNKQTGEPENYCFVELENPEAAQRAMLKLNGKLIPDTNPAKRFKLNFSSFGREQHVPEYSLFVGDITEDVDDLALYSAFARKYPSARSAKVILDEHGRSKGYGFVRFTEQRDVNRALLEMHHAPGIGKRLIKVSMALPKKAPAPETKGPEPHYSDYWETYRDQYAAWQHYYSSYYQYPFASHSDPVYAHYSYYTQHPEMYEQQQAAWQELHDQEQDDTPEDPHVVDHVDASNLEFMTRSEEVYRAMEESSFFPIDDATVTLEQAARC